MLNISILKEWFLEEKRDLPWRRGCSAYEVWISEVMLQQTQVAVVWQYFERWRKKFPTISHLAEASIEEVIKMWEGLGYYSRARFIHENAKILQKQFQGTLPSTQEELAQLKGLGPYTVGAILSFAFHKRAVAVDGNVIRVISRLFHREEDVSQRKVFEELVDAVLPEEESWVVMEALIELGSQICKKIPLCDKCPLQQNCLAYEKGVEHLLPKNKKKTKIKYLERDVAVIVCKDFFLLRKEKWGRVMGGLYEFPYVNRGDPWNFEFEFYREKELTTVKHGFTRFYATLYPVLYHTGKKIEVENHEWVSGDAITRCAFSSGHRRILKEIMTCGEGIGL